MDKEHLLGRFLEWARSRCDIRAVALVGSSARTDRPADEWSDLDLIVVVSDPQPYLSSTDWLEDIGHPWISTVERTATGEAIERRVLFEGGLDVDFIVLPIESARQRLQVAPIADIVQRGMRTLLDKDETLSTVTIPSLETRSPQPVTLAEFSETVNDFWFHAVWTAKKLRRGELWTAKSCCDVYMKHLLLRMVEWNARATQGWDLDTWFNGRFLEEWASPQVVRELGRVFAHYAEDDVWRALIATMDLFRRIARETAEHLAYPYPASGDQRVTAWVIKCESDRCTAPFHPPCDALSRSVAGEKRSCSSQTGES
jgi:aminoglycoside 6-adenylyltransferase